MTSSSSRIDNLSIYPEKGKKKSDHVPSMSSTSPTSEERSYGISAMMLFSEVKTKYRNAVNSCHNFRDYSKTTEGKIKLGLIFGGFLSGCALAYTSKSRYRWYRRMIPVGTTSLVAAMCYPHAAWNVTKKTAHTVSATAALTYSVSKTIALYTYNAYEKIKSTKDKNPTPPKETISDDKSEFIINEGVISKTKRDGDVLVIEDTVVVPKEEQVGNKTVSDLVPTCSKNTEKLEKVNFQTFISDPNLEKKVIAGTSSDKEKESGTSQFTDAVLLPSEKTDQCTSGDTGQAVAEDADLYTTR